MEEFNWTLRDPAVLLSAVVIVAITRTRSGFWQAYLITAILITTVYSFARADFVATQAFSIAFALLLWAGAGAVVRSQISRLL